MTPLALEAAAWAVSLIGAVIVIAGALKTARSWAGHQTAVVAPIIEALDRISSLRAREEQPRPASLTVTPDALTLQIKARAHARRGPIPDAADTSQLVRELNGHLDSIYANIRGLDDRFEDRKEEAEAEKRELNRAIEERAAEAKAQIETVKEDTKKEFVSGAQSQALGAALVLLGLAFQIMAKLM